MDSAGVGAQEQIEEQRARIVQNNLWLPQLDVAKDQGTQTHKEVQDLSQQTDDSEETMGTLQQKNSELKAKLDIQTFSVMMIEGEDSATKFYTGLPTWPVFLCLFLFLSPFVKCGQVLSLKVLSGHCKAET